MPIYRLKDEKLLPLKEKRIDLEKSIQSSVEGNLQEVFGLQLICSEFSLNNLRIDTLAFDEETNAFVVIEYKKDKSFSVIDQGYAYLALLLNNKAEFILEYNEKMPNPINRENIDWSQSRVIFVAHAFTKYQQAAIGFQDLPIELWEVRKYDSDLILFNELKAPEKSESIKTVTPTKNADLVRTEIKQYSVNDLIKSDWTLAKKLFEDFEARMQDLDQRFEVHPVRSHIGFKIDNKNVINVSPGKSRLRIELLRTHPDDIKDPERRVKYLEKSFKNWNQHVSIVNIYSDEDIDYAMKLIEQVYNRFID